MSRTMLCFVLLTGCSVNAPASYTDTPDAAHGLAVDLAPVPVVADASPALPDVLQAVDLAPLDAGTVADTSPESQPSGDVATEHAPDIVAARADVTPAQPDAIDYMRAAQLCASCMNFLESPARSTIPWPNDIWPGGNCTIICNEAKGLP